MAQYIYTVFLKPKVVRRLAQWVVRWFIPEQMRIRGVDLVLNQNDAVVSGALALGCYEGFELELFESMLKPGMTVIDIGANLGLYAAIAAKAVGPHGTVLAIEPCAENGSYLRRTVQVNGFTNLQIVPKAIGASRGQATLFLNPENKADHRIYGSSKTREGVPVEVTSLDDLLDELKIARVDVIKIDVQGAEALAFRGMTRCLARHPHVKVLMEFWPWGLEQAGCDAMAFLAELRRNNFDIQEIDGDHRALTPVRDDRMLATRRLERQYTNLLLQKSATSIARAA